jgi:hypothetical protein
MSETSIRGMNAQKYPREVGAVGAAKPMAERETAGHYAYDERGRPPQGGMVDRAGAFAMSALEGLPLVGPSFKNVTQDIAALAAYPFSDQPLGDIRQEMAARTDQAQADNPGTSFAGNVTGGVAGTVPRRITS